jgi:hypothetical protein
MDLTKANKVRITLLVSKPEKSIKFLVDGKLIKEWKDRSDFAGRGTGLVFGALSQSSNRISNIRVGHWDGSFDGEELPAQVSKEDAVEFANGDKLVGMITGITNNEAELSSHGLPLKVPLQRIRIMRFASGNTDEQTDQHDSVRVDLGSCGVVSLTMGTIDALNLTGSSAACGRIVLPVDTIHRIDFDRPNNKATSDVSPTDTLDKLEK